MEVFDIAGLLPTLLEIVQDRVVGYDDQIMKRFDHAIVKALRPTVKYDDSYIKKVLIHEAELIDFLVQAYDNPAGIEDVELPSYINKEEFRRLYNQTQKDKELVNVLKNEWNYYISKDTNNRVKAIQAEIVKLSNEMKEVGEDVEKVKEDTGEIKKSLGELKEDVNKGFNKLNERFDEKEDKNGCNNENRKKIPDVLTCPQCKANTTNVIGREKDLERLWELLCDKKHVMLTGMGGVGKTQLARLLFHKFGREFDEVAWIVYNGDFQKSVSDCIDTDTPRFMDERDEVDKYQNRDERPKAIIRTLRNDKKKKLFIIDNVENGAGQLPEQDEDLRDLTGWYETYILLISRSEVPLGHLYAKFDVGFLELEKCIELFKFYSNRKDSERETIEKIVKFANYHTMFIELLAKGVSEGEELGSYYQKIKKGFEGVDRKITSARNENKEATIEDHLKILYNMQVLEEKDKKIMNSFAVLPVNEVFTYKNIKDWFGFNESDIANVRKNGWLSYDDEKMMLVIQPIVRTIVRFDFKKDEQSKKSIAPEGTCDKILDYFRNHSYQFTIDRKKDRTFIYVEWMIRIAESVIGSIAQENNDDRVAALYYNIGVGYYELGEYKEALNCFEEAEKIRGRLLQIVQTNIAYTYDNIGKMYHIQNEYDMALKYYFQTLAIWRKKFNTPNLSIAESYSKIGGAYRKKGGKYDLIKALKYHEWALEIRNNKEKYKEGSLDVAISYNNIGTVYLANKHYTEAEEYFNRALAIVKTYENNPEEKKEGKKDHFMAELFYNMGELYLSQKEKVKAMEYYYEAYQKCLEDYGEHHPETKKVKNKIQKLN